MSAALKFEIFHQGELLREIPYDGGVVWVGRGEDCAIRLDDRAISRKHGVIRTTENGIEFEKKSKFGEARLNGKEVEMATLHGGENFEFGEFQLRVIRAGEVKMPPAPAPVEEVPPVESSPEVVHALDDSFDSGNPEGTAILDPSQDVNPMDFVESAEPKPHEAFAEDSDRAASPDVEPEGGVSEGGSGGGFDFGSEDQDGRTRAIQKPETGMKPILEFVDSSGGNTAYEITDEEVSLGRAQNCHVVLEDKKSSRRHLLITKKDGKYSIRDLGSSNGTLVNGERIEEQELHSGDVIQIGETKFVFKMVQPDYEAKKADFLQVPEEALPAPPPPSYSNPSPPLDAMAPFQSALPGGPEVLIENPSPAPDFSAPEEDRRSLITKLLDRFRTMPVRQQFLTGIVVLGGIYFLMDDSEPEQKARLQMGQATKKVEKKVEKKSTGAPTFDQLTPEQKSYIESEYNISFEFYKNRDYDSCLNEIEKIFSLVQDYKNAREIQSFAREGKRKLEAQEEERKRKEQERQAQVKLQSLIDQAGLLMDQKKYKEAEALFPEIELLQPENAVVSNWRKRILDEAETAEREKKEKAEREKIVRELSEEYTASKKLAEEKKYFEALDRYDALMERAGPFPKLAEQLKKDIKSAEDAINAEREPLVKQGKQFEQEGKFAEAYKAFDRAYKVDPTDAEAPEGMARIQGVLNARAKGIYSEGVIAESFSEYDAAEKKYREVLEVVPPGNLYYDKASGRIRRLSALRKPATDSSGGQQ